MFIEKRKVCGYYYIIRIYLMAVGVGRIAFYLRYSGMLKYVEISAYMAYKPERIELSLPAEFY